MGDSMFNIGDLVTRKSYDNDIIFKIIDIKEDIYVLKGVVVRLFADSPSDDLKIYNSNAIDDFSPEIDGYRSLERDEYFYLPGRILHIDGDNEYLEKCMNFYKKNRLKAYGVYVDERADLVIASAGGFPKDINLYQTSKTLSNSKIMIADGGTMIILSECSEGFGNQDCEDQIVKFTNMEEREKALRADFSIGGFVGYDFSDTAERYNMILVTEIPAEKFKNTKIHVVKTLDEAIRVAKELNDGSIDDMKVALLPHGANTLPKYR